MWLLHTKDQSDPFAKWLGGSCAAGLGLRGFPESLLHFIELVERLLVITREHTANLLESVPLSATQLTS